MTGCERILDRLERGPATAAELYATTYCVVHSRIAELRKRGYVITCEHTGGHEASSYLYRLLDRAECVAGEKTGEETASPHAQEASALRSVEQAALPTAGKPLPQRAACSPIQLELETESRFGSSPGGAYASGESRAA